MIISRLVPKYDFFIVEKNPHVFDNSIKSENETFGSGKENGFYKAEPARV